MVDRRKMGKRGMFASLYLVMLTLLMCGLVLGFYASHQDKLKGSLVSPLPVVEVSDGLEVFEMRERELILLSLEKSGMEKDAFKSEFISGLSPEMREFIFSNLTLMGVEIIKESDKETLLTEGLYSVREESGNLVLKRLRIGKRIFLKAAREEDVDFPVEFVFEFEREYLISRKGSGYLIESLS
jgi:hypothetical protein